MDRSQSLSSSQAPRLRCCVPGCRRTHANVQGFSEWVCQRHWSQVPKGMRRVYSRAKRRKKPGAALDRIWCRCRDTAIMENFTGLGL